MLVKVCGLKEVNNIQSIADLGPDMIGLNFYRKSKRFIQDDTLGSTINAVRVGVFVKEPLESLKKIVSDYSLDFAQLHGDESTEYCKDVQKAVKVIKVFRVGATFDFMVTKSYQFCDLILFDTMTTDYGGSGNQFNWDILNNYEGDTPFLLSGGIGPNDVEAIEKFQHPKFIGVDINSKFEDIPGLKDVASVGKFIKALKQQA